MGEGDEPGSRFGQLTETVALASCVIVPVNEAEVMDEMTSSSEPLVAVRAACPSCCLMPAEEQRSPSSPRNVFPSLDEVGSRNEKAVAVAVAAACEQLFSDFGQPSAQGPMRS